MPAPEEISKLVKRYTINRKQYRSSSYKEADVRNEFLDPMFKALGWDVDNTQGHAPQYREVVTEESLDVEGSTKSPDYSFRIGGITKFFVEAKKPSVDICSDTIPAFQLKRYAWSAKLPLSILINFEDISVYDCRFKPVKTDDPTKGRILYIPFTELEERWDELTNIFTKDAIFKGSFDKYAQEKKRGTSEVDAEILKDIEGWREELAKNIARRNELDTEEVNFAVQRLIDRILFLRICEDRGTEPENQLYDVWQNKRDIYKHLMDIFQLADAKYNSGLFHFLHDKKRSTKRDTISPYLVVDDKVLASIIWDIYYPNSPYQFDVIPADILGQVYEQFLGKVIKLSSSGKTATVEEKPEVKKAGGVYYTPTYIVEYIVENTVGKLCEGKSPEEMKELKILDPACGSGSFLIVAYKKLLDEHLKWYEAKNPKKHKDAVFQNEKGTWQLTLQEKKRILLNNIHGVDIDIQAVEVTKLNLLLKALEGESKESLDNFGKWIREPALPDLGSNIKCGNSLIDFDIIDHLQDISNDERDKELAKINPFSWDAEFPEIMRGGGFDAVVGNPPWLMAGYYEKESLEYLRITYQSAKGKFDLYYLFVEKASTLLREEALFGMIIPNKFFHTKSASNLRKIISDSEWIQKIIDFGDFQIFSKATNYSCILLYQIKPHKIFSYMKAGDKITIIDNFDIDSDSLSTDPWHFESKKVKELFLKMRDKGIELESIVKRFGTGVQTGADKVFTMTDDSIEKHSIEKEVQRPIFRGRNIRRYNITREIKNLIFPYTVKNSTYTIFEGEELKKFPKTFDYLSQFKEKLSNRVWFDKGPIELSGKWFGLMYLDSDDSFSSPHILTPSLSDQSNFTIGTGDVFVTGTAGVTSIIPKNEVHESLLYLLGTLNSSLLSFYIIKHSPIFSGGYYKFSAPYLKKIPIRTINFSDPDDKSRHDKMVKLVERMLKLHKDVKEASTPDKQEKTQRRIDATDREINALVYELYGLTEEEIKIVEGN